MYEKYLSNGVIGGVDTSGVVLAGLVSHLCCVPFQNDASGEKLKDLAIEMCLTTSAVAYLKGKVPPKR